MGEQVLTRLRDAFHKILFNYQGDNDNGHAGTSSSSTLDVHAVARKSPRPARKRNRGGWKSSKGLSWAEVKTIHEIAHRSARAGMPFNRLATIRTPDGLQDSERQRFVSRSVAHLGQTLKRRGHAHLGITVLEKRAGTDHLHGHHLFHLPPKAGDAALSGWADGDVRHLRRAAPSDVRYITKQRLPLPPDFEAKVRAKHPRQPGDRISGRRWTATGAARALLVEKDAENTTPSNANGATVPPPIPVPDPHGLFGPLDEQPAPPRPWVRTGPRRLKLTVPEQVPLPMDLPPDAIDLMAGLGETHDAIAVKVGVSRPQATNILNRQFGASRPVVRRVLELARAAA